MIKNVLSAKRKEYIIIAMVTIFMMIIGELIEIFGKNISNTAIIIPLIITTLISFIMCVTHIEYFSNMISMGRTRKEYLLLTTLSCVLKYSAIALLGVGMVVINNKTLGVKIGLEYSCIIKYVFMYIIGLSILEMFFGAILIRYSKKVLWVMWAIWMILCILPSFIQHAMEQKPDSILAKFGKWILSIRVTEKNLVIAGSIIAVVLMIVNVVSIMKQDVV